MRYAISPTRLHRLDIQGFEDVPVNHLAEVAPWLRLTPAMCAVMTITGTVLSAPSLLSLLAAVALAGAVLPVHAFDLLYNHGIRHLTGTRALPLRGAPNRFACGLGALWLVITASLFQSGAIAAGFAVGGLLGATAALAAATDICMPSLLFRKLSGWPPARAGYAKEVAS